MGTFPENYQNYKNQYYYGIEHRVIENIVSALYKHDIVDNNYFDSVKYNHRVCS